MIKYCLGDNMLEMRNINIFLKQNDRSLVEDFNFVLNRDNKVAIIGEEGNGKSTLLKMIFDSNMIEEYCDFSGEINKKNLKISYLEQLLDLKWYQYGVCDYFINDSFFNIDYEKYNQLNEIMNIFADLKLDTNLIEENRIISSLSGGEKVKMQIAKILFEKPDIILLDEPTNDLDIETLEWLEIFIKKSKTPIIFISHDETLLSKTANVIIHFEQIKKKSGSRYTIYRSGYEDYVKQRESLLNKQEMVACKQREDYNKQKEKWMQVYQKVDYQQETISRKDPHGAKLLKKKMKTLKAQEKRLEKEKEDFLAIPDVEEAINFFFSKKIIRRKKMVLNFELEKLKIDEKLLAQNIKLLVSDGEHVVIIGRNGIGKSTLLRRIKENLSQTDFSIGYMPQNYEDIIDLKQTPIDFLVDGVEKERITRARNLMGCMKFTSEEMETKIRNLSGGQRAKLLIIKFIIDENDFLILDEPTRNLSPLSNPIIRKVLRSFSGAIISVSHDRKFINEVCDVCYELTNEGIKKTDI